MEEGKYEPREVEVETFVSLELRTESEILSSMELREVNILPALL